jgi:cytoskeletal protein CcmA (bactofilin family)
LSGEVIGDVYALKHIELAPNARVTGNVYYNLIEMAGGAEVNGSLIHYDNSSHKADSGAPVKAEIPASTASEPSEDEYSSPPQDKVSGGFN